MADRVFIVTRNGFPYAVHSSEESAIAHARQIATEIAATTGTVQDSLYGARVRFAKDTLLRVEPWEVQP